MSRKRQPKLNTETFALQKAFFQRLRNTSEWGKKQLAEYLCVDISTLNMWLHRKVIPEKYLGVLYRLVVGGETPNSNAVHKRGEGLYGPGALRRRRDHYYEDGFLIGSPEHQGFTKGIDDLLHGRADWQKQRDAQLKRKKRGDR